MNSYCEHCSNNKSDDNLLLDDENSVMVSCNSCNNLQQVREENVNQRVQWPIQPNTTNSNGNGNLVSVFATNGVAAADIKNNMMDDHIDTLEDSPLLINDCYTESGGDFHCHSVLSENNDSSAWKKLATASVLCFLFMVTELVGGFIAGSLAVMTDAAHLFSDFIGFCISLLSIYIARKSATKNMTFGYYRAEVLGAFLSVLTVWLLAAIFALLAINRILKKEYEIDSDTMILVASLGLVINIIMGAVLHGMCHEHGHSHGLNQNQQTISTQMNNSSNNSNTNINVRAAAAHVLGDLLQSLGVLIAAIIIKVSPQAKLADPICTLIFSIIVICTTAKVARDSIWLLLEGSPRSCNDILYELKNISNVQHIHNLHVWTLSPGKNVASVHLCVDKYCDRDVVLQTATSIIQSRITTVSCTIQVEVYHADIVNSCKFCQPFQC